MAESIYVKTAKSRNYFLAGMGVMAFVHVSGYLGYVAYRYG